MIEISNTEIHGWEPAIRGMRNPMNSWGKSDSYHTYVVDDHDCEAPFEFFVGTEDLKLMKNLAKAGTDHRKYLRMIVVYADINAPLYWWKEFDTYKIGTVANSCSTMHKIHSRDLTIKDFSTDHLDVLGKRIIEMAVLAINDARAAYLKSNCKADWYQMIQLLPSSYNQKRTVMLNYEVLANMYKSRKNHKLDEWKRFCNWIEDWLPYSSKLITGKDDGDV